MSEIIQFPEPEKPIEFIGPFEAESVVSCHGYQVPNLTVIDQGGGTIRLRLDRRFEIEAPKEEVERWIWFIANAMAVSSGYSCFGENSVKEPNPFKMRIGRLW